MNDNEITGLLTTVLIFMIGILSVLVIIYIVLRLKMSTKKEAKVNKVEKSKSAIDNATVYNKQSIFSFMDFDKVEDNMIIRKNGNKFLMIIECQGINYDLMSGMEKNGVEQGFIQFLNTLRYPIQIYVQTRTVNLEGSIISYKARVKEIQDRLLKKQMEYNKLEGLGVIGKELDNAKLELTREKNLYEYGIDIINNTERMSLNRNILRKHYYVIISYTPEEMSNSNYSKDEIKNIAFSDLYTRAQSIISALGVCGINGKILDSNGLAELLYIAYNRDDSEVYNLEKAFNSVYDEMYSTAPDVFEKRIKEINIRIKEEAQKKANEVIIQAAEESEKERRAKQKEAEMEDLINQMANLIIEENESLVGSELAEKAKEKLSKQGRKKKITKEGE
ncbi:MAG TPA: hypothetical protein OIM61_00665 [Clostridiaceae bacterium]|jgi:hypothetical protein|nr:hypothetical protein [Clostridiales bacterium]HJJ17795.1 hypothetical protein [Clostridiaceae bacterium]